MNNALQKGLSSLESLIKVQEGYVEYPSREHYYVGLLNGLRIAHCCFVDEEPKFASCLPHRRDAKIRHKCSRKRK